MAFYDFLLYNYRGIALSSKDESVQYTTTKALSNDNIP